MDKMRMVIGVLSGKICLTLDPDGKSHGVWGPDFKMVRFPYDEKGGTIHAVLWRDSNFINKLTN